MIDLERITHPLQLSAGSHRKGSGRGCAMNAISYINGDTEITDFPDCSARPLSRLVQRVNDSLADPSGLLSPENAVIALDLGWKTVGTSGVSKQVLHAWLAEMLDSEWGLSRLVHGADRDILAGITSLHLRAAAGAPVGLWEWHTASQNMRMSTNFHLLDAAAISLLVAKVGHGGWAQASDAAASASEAMSLGLFGGLPSVSRRIKFTNSAIDAWRRLAGLDETAVDYEKTNTALQEVVAV